MSTVQANKKLVLPKEPVEPTRFSPKVLMVYGMPKVGKTKILSELPHSLTLDLEGGTEMYKMVKHPIDSIADIMQVVAAINEEGSENLRAGKTGDDIYPYKFLAVDTVDKLEDYCITSATQKYRKTVLGKDFKGDTILELAHGGGYYLLREEVKNVLVKLSQVCKHLILISHVNDKNIEKEGILVSGKDITMSGKLKVIIPSLCDAIGYLSRKPSSKPGNPDELWINFRTSEASTMGARQEYLAGQNFQFSWEKIFPDTLRAA